MSVDVLNYQQLEQAELVLASAQTQIPFGRFGFGEELGQKIGVGFEPDGVRDYLPSDDSRHIDWVATASRGDGGISLRQFYEDQNPLTVVVSDVTTQSRYAETVGDPLSARSLGLVVASFVLKSAARVNPVMTSWTNGFKGLSLPTTAFEGRDAAKRAILSGIDSAAAAQLLANQIEEADQAKGLFRRKTPIELPKPESLADAIDHARNRSKRMADAAKFIIISDFKVSDEVFDLMHDMKKYSEVVGIQITNPLMRALDPRVKVVRGSDGRDVAVATQEQRAKYNSTVTDIFQKREQKLKLATHSLFVIDTLSPTIARVA